MQLTIFDIEINVERLSPGQQFKVKPGSKIVWEVREQFSDASGHECKAFNTSNSCQLYFFKHGTPVFLIQKT
jgi:hypothetical protein